MSTIEKRRDKRRPNPKSSMKEIVGSHGHKPHGPSILWPAMYEHLRAKGYSKEKAARISNAAWNKKHRGQRTNAPTSVRGLIKSEVRNPSDRIAYRYTQQNHLEDNVAGITKSELPQAVRDYIDILEDELARQGEVITKQAEDIAELRVELDERDEERLLANSDNDEIVKAAIAKADPDTAGVLTMLYGEVAKSRAKAHEDAEKAIIAKADALPYVHVGEGTVTEVLKTAYGFSPEFGEQLFAVLQHANARVEQSDIFKELGASGAQTTIAKSAEAFVAELRKANPEMSEEEALAEFYAQDGNYEQARPGQEV